MVNLYYERSKAIEFVTLDKICKALQYSIDEIIVYPMEDKKEAVK
ncbi:helix-turn-helix domain-containing protein [Sporolactobacillus mangiferae]